MVSLSYSASNDNSSNQLPDSSGIYQITCIVTNKFYIGSAVNLRKRKNDHWHNLRQNTHHNPILQNAWNKYGEQAFVFEVLEQVLTISLTAREQYWFKKLNPFPPKGFNVLKEAGSALGTKRTPEHTEKVRQANLGKKLSPEHIEKIRQANLGKKLPLATREKQSRALLGRKWSPEHSENWRKARMGRPVTEKTREKLRQINLGKKHSPKTLENMSHAQQARWNKKKESESI